MVIAARSQFSQNVCAVEPGHAVKARTTERITEKFRRSTLSRQGSKCRILSVLMGSIFDRDRIRFSCFRYASDEIWTVPWRGATGYFYNKGGLRKMAYPLGRALASMQNPEFRQKIKPGQTWKVLSSVLGQVANRLHKVAVSLCGKRRQGTQIFTPGRKNSSPSTLLIPSTWMSADVASGRTSPTMRCPHV